mgnify:CR=1 FL=1
MMNSAKLQLFPTARSGFHFKLNAENWIARTKTALNLLGLAPWKNTQLLGTSNVISFLLGPTDGVHYEWSKKIGDYDKEVVIVSSSHLDEKSI